MESPKALLVGCGHGVGLELSKHLAKDYEITQMSGNWDTRGMDSVDNAADDFDLIVFNQNGGPLPNNIVDGIIDVNHWNQTLFTNHQLPYYIMQKQTKSPKVIMIVTGFVRVNEDYPDQLKGYADQFRLYIGLKLMNMELMKMFSLHKDGIYCCLAPSFHKKTIDTMALEMYNTIMTVDESYNRKLIDETGTITKLEMY